jgi:hypothetical protein
MKTDYQGAAPIFPDMAIMRAAFDLLPPVLRHIFSAEGRHMDKNLLSTRGKKVWKSLFFFRIGD